MTEELPNPPETGDETLDETLRRVAEADDVIEAATAMAAAAEVMQSMLAKRSET